MKKSYRVFALTIVGILLSTLLVFGASTVTKGLIGEQDFHGWSGTTADKTFTRAASTGGTLTLNSVGTSVDALIVYGGGVNYTKATISSALTAIGTANNVELVLRPGTWVIAAGDADLTIPANITLYMPAGATVSVATGRTLTINGPFKADLSLKFTTAGTGKVVVAGKKFPEWWGAKDDSGTTDCTVAIQAALTNGGDIELVAPAKGYYKITDTLSMAIANTNLYTNNHAEIRQDTAAKGGISITASKCKIFRVAFTGKQKAAYQAVEIGIYAAGADSANYLSGLVLEDVQVVNFGNSAIQLLFVRYADIRNPSVADCYYAGIAMLSAVDGKITGGIIKDIIANAAPGANAYGVIVSKHSGTEATYPLSKRILVDGVNVRGVKTWTAFDTHGGEDIIFANCRAYDCNIGYALGAVSAADNGGVFKGPLRCKVLNSTSYINHGAGEVIATTSAGYGVVVQGHSTSRARQCVVANNIFDGHGKSNGTLLTSAVSYYYETTDLADNNNIILNAGLVGVFFNYGNTRARIRGLTIDTLSVAAGGAAVSLQVGVGTANVDCQFIDLVVNVGGTNLGVYATDTNADVHFINPSITSGGRRFSGAAVGLTNFGAILPLKRVRADWDPGVINAAGNETLALVVTEVDSYCEVLMATTLTLDGLVLSAVPFTDLVTLRLDSPSAGAINLAAMTVYMTINHAYTAYTLVAP